MVTGLVGSSYRYHRGEVSCGAQYWLWGGPSCRGVLGSAAKQWVGQSPCWAVTEPQNSWGPSLCCPTELPSVLLFAAGVGVALLGWQASMVTFLPLNWPGFVGSTAWAT